MPFGKRRNTINSSSLGGVLQFSLRTRNQQPGQQEEKIILRMGIHSGTGASYVDINGNINIAGAVANVTQRVMAFGEDWHIIASQNAFDDIATLDKTCQKLFHRIGLGETKHKDSIPVFNVYRLKEQPFGNPETPAEIQNIEKGAPTSADAKIGSRTETGKQRVPDITGMWTRETDQLCMLITQVEDRINSRFAGLNHDHVLEGRFDYSTNKFACVTIRTHKNGSKRSEFYGTLELLSNGSLRVITSGTDGADLPADFTEDTIFQRFKG